MRIDVITIFPDYLAPLDLSLIGKARTRGLVDLRVHDLRAWTHDNHNSVDDAPFGGGAGMVMKPQPWAEALAAVLDDGRAGRLVETGSPDQLAAGLVELLADPEARADLVAAGRIRADKYDWSRVADQILRVYETVTVDAGPVVVSD